MQVHDHVRQNDFGPHQIRHAEADGWSSVVVVEITVSFEASGVYGSGVAGNVKKRMISTKPYFNSMNPMTFESHGKLGYSGPNHYFRGF